MRRIALDELQGVGSILLGQWEEWTGKAYHVRRRLTAKEQEQVGDVIDIRGTDEAERRRAAVQSYLPRELRDWRE